MIAMQYKILLPDSYDMGIIRERVKNNGNKTDGFQGLLFKAYLISEKGEFGNSKNEYAPLYVWQDEQGMNEFIFGGFFDNILNSFGWQNINIGITMINDLKKNFITSKFVVEIENDIPETKQMKALKSLSNFENDTSKLLIYNPDKWNCVEFHFFEEIPEAALNLKVYRLLHLSM